MQWIHKISLQMGTSDSLFEW